MPASLADMFQSFLRSGSAAEYVVKMKTKPMRLRHSPVSHAASL